MSNPIPESERTEIEAAAFRRLVKHLRDKLREPRSLGAHQTIKSQSAGFHQDAQETFTDGV